MMMVDVERGRAEGIALAKELEELDKGGPDDEEREREREHQHVVVSSEDLFGR
jgi:hypothetical protein